MEKTTGQSTQLIKHLNALITLDFDAIDAYEAAIARLPEGSDKAQLARFLGEHQRHIADLAPLIRELGGTPTAKADFKRVLTEGKVVLAGLAGDRAVLQAMKSNEETTVKTYRRATEDAGLPLEVRSVVERNFSDEQRHLAWLEQRLSVSAQAS